MKIDLNMNNIHTIKEKNLIILDINGVLVDKKIDYDFNYHMLGNIKADYFKINNKYIVFKRPYLKEFIRSLFKKYDVAIFSSTTLRNLTPIINNIFTSEQQKKLIFIWDRSFTNPDPDPDYYDTYSSIKYLFKVKDKYPEYDKIIICDDDSQKIRFNSKDETITVYKYKYNNEDESDNVLQLLLQQIEKNFSN